MNVRASEELISTSLLCRCALQTQLKSCGECRKLFTRIGCVWRQLKGLHLEHSWRPIFFSIANGMQTNCNEQTIPTKGEEYEARGMLSRQRKFLVIAVKCSRRCNLQVFKRNTNTRTRSKHSFPQRNSSSQTNTKKMPKQLAEID